MDLISPSVPMERAFVYLYLSYKPTVPTERKEFYFLELSTEKKQALIKEPAFLKSNSWF
jgi:hypothetical protein